jgi:hypothetical protein
MLFGFRSPDEFGGQPFYDANIESLITIAYITLKLQDKYALMNIFESTIEEQTVQRRAAINKLKGFLMNPGRFSILVLGLRGTGKTHWIKEICENCKNEDCLSGLVIVNCPNIEVGDLKFWDSKFKEAHKKVLLIEDVDQLSKLEQEFLFSGLSTGLGAKYGFDSKSDEFRIVFTSTKDIETLRINEEILSHKFFDRISQLVVKFPSFTEANREIWNDFKATWKKMHFQFNNKLPGNELKEWLNIDGHKLHGQFRDLDKIAINWHNYRLIGENENQILSKVKKDFEDFLHYPEHKSELPSTFYINSSLKFDDNLKNFRRQFKEWVKSKHGSLKKGEEHVGVSHRTMERW